MRYKFALIYVPLVLILILSSFPATIISDGSTEKSSDLGIIWQKGAHGEILDAYGNLLMHYADDSGKIYYKIRELSDKKVFLKDMERVYENGGELKKTLNVVERTEDSGSVIRWLEEGLTTAEAKTLGKRPSGWKHILEEHEDDFIKYGISGESEIKELIYRSIKEGSPQTIPIEKGGGTVYIHYVTSDKPITTIVGSNGYIVTSHPGLP